MLSPASWARPSELLGGKALDKSPTKGSGGSQTEYKVQAYPISGSGDPLQGSTRGAEFLLCGQVREAKVDETEVSSIDETEFRQLTKLSAASFVRVRHSAEFL